MKPVLLMILDGFGIGKNYEGNAIYKANAPTLKGLQKYAHAQLLTSGESVGLPEGQMGNSEVGHLNIGSGRVIYQSLTMITKAIEHRTFFENEALLNSIKNVKDNNSCMHLMGLVSKGGVHSHMSHLTALVKLCKQNGLENVYIHAITDGRDVSPQASLENVYELQRALDKIGVGEIATICGRYYAMDRDGRWDRTKAYYDLVTDSRGESYHSARELIGENYHREIYDEFINPGYITKEGKATATIKDNDSVIFFNFRPDRARQIVRALVDENFSGFERKFMNVHMTTMTQYDKTIPNTHIAFDEVIPSNTLGEVLSRQGKKQLRIAETEKYAHVTFFFNGGREVPFEGEDRVLIPSPRVATYDLKPEMSAQEVTDALLDRIDKYDCIILNFANPDMVGHTGSIPAAIKAVETIDKCVARTLKKLDENGGVAIITADHGNCEEMLTEEGKPVTSHTTNPVPIYLCGTDDYKLDDGALCDIAPTILELLNIRQPEEMTGKSLLERK